VVEGRRGLGRPSSAWTQTRSLRCFFCCVIEVSQYAVRSLGGMFLTVPRLCASINQLKPISQLMSDTLHAFVWLALIFGDATVVCNLLKRLNACVVDPF